MSLLKGKLASGFNMIIHPCEEERGRRGEGEGRGKH